LYCAQLQFGKDFDKIHKYIVQKVKNRADAENKTRDQVRHFYYRTWRWLEKYVQFGDGKMPTSLELIILTFRGSQVVGCLLSYGFIASSLVSYVIFSDLCVQVLVLQTEP